jgi:energy-coupling factor transport system permease protein
MRYHSTVCSLWLAAALTPGLLTKNPYYLLLAIVAVGFTYYRVGRDQASRRGWHRFLQFGLVLLLVSLAFNLVSVRAGATTLFTLPEIRREFGPSSSPTVIRFGGDVTLESLVFGLSSGLSLLTVLLAFATFNVMVDHYQLLRGTPRFLYQSAIVVSIAITFIPQLMLAQREIREAQVLRGHNFRWLRDLVPLFTALLAEGLERSIVLAESMEARGFAGRSPGQRRTAGLRLNGLIALALALLAGGAFARSYFPNKTLGGIGLVLGLGTLAGALWWLGRSVQRSRYRRVVWRQKDKLVAAASALTISVMLATWATQRVVLIFYPYPRFDLPAFSPVIGLGLLLLATPVLAGRLTGEAGHD